MVSSEPVNRYGMCKSVLDARQGRNPTERERERDEKER
jgi:hypothetical protein